jgi:hypothetical protein
LATSSGRDLGTESIRLVTTSAAGRPLSVELPEIFSGVWLWAMAPCGPAKLLTWCVTVLCGEFSGRQGPIEETVWPYF